MLDFVFVVVVSVVIAFTFPSLPQVMSLRAFLSLETGILILLVKKTALPSKNPLSSISLAIVDSNLLSLKLAAARTTSAASVLPSTWMLMPT